MEKIDENGAMAKVLAELTPLPERIPNKEDCYFMLPVGNGPLKDHDRTLLLLQDPKQFDFFTGDDDECEDDYKTDSVELDGRVVSFPDLL